MARRRTYYTLPDTNVHTNWTSPTPNIFKAIWKLRSALASGGQYVLIKEYNENCDFPLMVDYSLPYREQVKKVFKHKLWVVASYGKDHPEYKDKGNIPFLIKMINILIYPLKYIPRKSVLRMNKYTSYTFRIGSTYTGYSVQFQIPKKFSFKD